MLPWVWDFLFRRPQFPAAYFAADCWVIVQKREINALLQKERTKWWWVISTNAAVRGKGTSYYNSDDLNACHKKMTGLSCPYGLAKLRRMMANSKPFSSEVCFAVDDNKHCYIWCNKEGQNEYKMITGDVPTVGCYILGLPCVKRTLATVHKLPNIWLSMTTISSGFETSRLTEKITKRFFNWLARLSIDSHLVSTRATDVSIVFCWHGIYFHPFLKRLPPMRASYRFQIALTGGWFAVHETPNTCLWAKGCLCLPELSRTYYQHKFFRHGLDTGLIAMPLFCCSSWYLLSYVISVSRGDQKGRTARASFRKMNKLCRL